MLAGYLAMCLGVFSDSNSKQFAICWLLSYCFTFCYCQIAYGQEKRDAIDGVCLTGTNHCSFFCSLSCFTNLQSCKRICLVCDHEYAACHTVDFLWDFLDEA